MRPASVFAGQTRTNQPSWAAALATGPPTSSAMRAIRKNARICPPAPLSHVEYVSRKSGAAPNRPRDRGYTTRKMAGLIQIKVRRHRAGTLIARGAGVNDDQQRNHP